MSLHVQLLEEFVLREPQLGAVIGEVDFGEFGNVLFDLFGVQDVAELRGEHWSFKLYIQIRTTIRWLCFSSSASIRKLGPSADTASAALSGISLSR